jgi:hydroxymethylpyrimidine pyrophosphatase-like HAD family hydrolase
VSYLPVQGAIAENGGLFYSADGELRLISQILDIQNHRANLSQTFTSLSTEYPTLHESSDNRFRITDWTFDVKGLSRSELQTLQERCESQGWSFTYSTVQCHIKPPGQDKATALLEVLQAQFSGLDLDHVLTIGDSPNDESLFNPVQFPCSVGVANVLDYVNQMTYPPRFVTQHAEAEGFCEISEMLLAAQMH